MRIERDASNSFTLAARPTVTPSRWLLRFNWVEDPSVEQLCIATAYAQTGQPVLLTFTEVDASPDPQAAEVTLPPGQWSLRVYEQDTTSLNYANSDRLVYDVLVEVVGAEAEPPAPTDPCAGGGGDCDEPFTVTINGPSNVFAEVDDPCGGDFNVPVNNTDGDLVGSEVDGAWRIGDAIVFRDGVPFGSVAAEGNIDVPSDCAPCEVVAGMDGRDVADCIAEGERVIAFCNLIGKDEITASVIIVCADGAGKADGLRGTYQRKDSDGADIGSPGQIDPGGSEDILCPDAAYQLKDSAGNNIGSAGAIVSNGSANIVAPDATAVVKNLNGTTLITEAILSNASENIIAPIPLKFGWGAGDADTLVWTVTDDEAGAYTTYTNDGGSGSITYSKNGAGFASLTGTITLAVSDTIVVRRATPTSNGWVKWAP